MTTSTADRPRTRPIATGRRRGAARRALAGCAAVLAVFALGRPAPADIAQSIDDGELSGRVTVNSEGLLTLTPPDGGEARTMALADVHRVVFGDDLMVRGGDTLLLDAAAREQATVSATIKLRAGLHHIVLPYWQGEGDRQLELTLSGPGLTGGEVPANRFYCYRDADQAPAPTAGFDEQGFRVPELTEDALEGDDLRRRVRYTYLVGEGDGNWTDMSVFSRMTRRRGGVAGNITYRMAGQSEHFGIVFTGFIRVDRDGEYTFTLTADDGARLYLGQPDQFNAAIPPSVDAPEWVAVTAYGTRLTGKLAELTDTHAALSVPVNEDDDLALNLGLELFTELWAAGTDLDTLDRGGESEVDDTAYIQDRNNPDNVLKVPGTLVALDAEKLHFNYRGQVRQINRDRVLGVALRSADRPRAPRLGYHQTLHLKTGQSLPGHVTTIDERDVVFAIAGGEAITLPRGDVYMVRNEQGRVLDLTAIEPTAVEEVPYFDHVIPYRNGSAFDGETITLYDNNEYKTGLAVHARNRLHYRLDGGFTRLRAGVGLLKPGGRMGNVTARVLGDGKVLWEHENLTPDAGRIDLDIDLAGVDRLILEVDFGEGQNVGDRAAWVNPLLIRDTVE